MRNLFFTLLSVLVVTVAVGQPVDQYQRLDASTIIQNSEYGRGVCINGDYAIVSALLDNHEGTITAGGSAYIYHYEDGVWNFQYKLMAEDAQANDHFGRSVFINDTHAIVGCTYSDDPESYNGSAYIFENNNDGTWSQQAKLLASDRRRLDRFGVSVGISGNHAIIGCYGADYNVDGTDYVNAGAAYIYELDGGVWGNEVILRPTAPLNEEKFGWSVSILDNVALIGGYEDRQNEADGVQGAAYVFQLSGGVWSQTQKIVPADIADGDNFGYSVDLTNGFAIVGAMTDTEAATESGSAYIYRNDAGTFVQEQKITPSNGEAGDNFGFSVGIDGGQAIVGSWHSNKGYGDTGSAYIFTRDAGTWTQSNELVAEDAALNDQNGWFVSISGDFALTGAPRWDTDRSDLSVDQDTNEGTAYIFASADVGTPGPSVESTLPVNGATGVVVNQVVEIVFDADIAFTDAAGQIVVAKSSDNLELARYDVTGATTNSHLSINADTLFISNLTFVNGTQYYVQFVNNPIADLSDAMFGGLTQTTDFTFTTVNVNPIWNVDYPALSDTSATNINLNLSVSFTGDVTAGNYFAVLTADEIVSESQVLSGQNGAGTPALWSASDNINSNEVTVQNVGITSLTSETTYYISTVIQGAQDSTSSVITLPFTTLDTAAPLYVATYPSVLNNAGTEAILNVSVDEDASVFYVLSQNTTQIPSIANVINELDGNGDVALSADSVGVSANSVLEISLENLDYETTYAVYVVTKDLQGNFIETTTPTMVEFTTPTMRESLPFPTFTPANEATDIATSQSISIQFNKAIYLVSNPTEEVSNATVEALLSFEAINNGVTSPYDAPKPPIENVAFTATYDAVNYIIAITPNLGLTDKQTYRITVGSVLDENELATKEHIAQFTTADESAPVTQFINPTNGSSDFDILSDLTIVFDEKIWAGSRKVYTSDLSGLITFTDVDNTRTVDFEAVIDSSYREVTVKPLKRLDPSVNYSLEFGAVADSVGHVQSSSAILNFQSGSSLNVWTGAGDLTNFTDNQNWVSDYVVGAGIIIPTGTEIATITEDVELDFILVEAMGRLTVDTSVTVTVTHEILIESSENGNGSFINNGSLIINPTNIKVEQLIPSANQWYYLATPVASSGSYTIEGTIDEFVAVNKSSGAYVDISFGNTLYPMEGTLLEGEGLLTFEGELNNGEISVTVENNINNLGWNLIGNPYSSAIDWDSIQHEFKADIENNFWVWRSSNQYGTYNGNLGIGVNLSGNASQIPSFQSFWVKSTTNGDLTFNNASRVHNDKTYFEAVGVAPIASISNPEPEASLKSASAQVAVFPYLTLSGINGSVVDETKIAFVPNATAGVDNLDTEKKFGSNIAAIELFAVVNNTDLSISSFPEMESEITIALGYKVQAQGTYRIRLDENLFGEGDVEIKLVDTDLGFETPMEQGSYYEFQSTAIKSSTRFELVISPIATNPTNIQENVEGVTVTAFEDQVKIETNVIDGITYKIYDLAGFVVKVGSVESSITTVQLSKAGVYLVEVTSLNNKTVKKVIVE